MRLVEEVVEFTPGRLARARRVTRADDWFFDGGLAAAPDPLPPGPLSMRVAALNDFKFPDGAGPGAVLEVTARVAGRMGRLTKIEGQVTADGRIVASGAITLAEVTRADEDR
jgi:3-hydroxymyristoyl/3-hydroxydecanoyl-(acyl carrier protein) dehydratase